MAAEHLTIPLIKELGIFTDQLAEMRQKAALLKFATGKEVPGFMVFHIPVDCFEEAQIAKGYCTERTFQILLSAWTQ